MERLNLGRRKVYDPVQRLLHWAIALATLVLLATGLAAQFFDAGRSRETVWDIHVEAGYCFAFALVGRLFWGVVGPFHARLSTLWTWHALLESWRVDRGRESLALPRQFGHAPAAALAYLGLYVVLVFMAGSGLALAGLEKARGPFASALFDSVWLEGWFAGPHEWLAYGIVIFIGAHLGAMSWHESRDRTPIMQAMFSGYQYRDLDRDADRSSQRGVKDSSIELALKGDKQ